MEPSLKNYCHSSQHLHLHAAHIKSEKPPVEKQYDCADICPNNIIKVTDLVSLAAVIKGEQIELLDIYFKLYGFFR